MSKLLQKYLRFWAKYYLKRTKPKIVAITGSIGKTSTKEAIFEVLKIKYGNDVRKSEGNLNNETGVPLAILGYKKSPRRFYEWFPIILGAKIRALFGKKYTILVLEMAADKPGDIKYLTEFARPDVACVTSIAQAHMQAFGSIEKIAEEKIELIKALNCEGTAIINEDDAHLKKYLFKDAEMLSYAINAKANFEAKNIITEIDEFKSKTIFQVVTEDEKFKAMTPTLGRVWNVYSALAAVACGKIFDMPSSDIIKGLENVKTEKHRMEVLKGKNGTLIIDDSYNANPLSMRAALDVLNFLPQPKSGGRKIVCLGDMLEIGKISRDAHKIIGEYARRIADEVIAVGTEAVYYEASKCFQNANEAGDYLLGNIRENDIILIKASRAIGLDKVVEMLRANPKS